MTAAPGNIAILHRFGLRCLDRHAYRVVIEVGGTSQSNLAAVKPHIHDRSSGHAQPAVVLGIELERREAANLTCQLGGITGPSLGHRTAAEHGDPGGTIHRRHATDA